jgi:4'-phosphopantetheinyl transferase
VAGGFSIGNSRRFATRQLCFDGMRDPAEWSAVKSVPTLGAADIHLWCGRLAAGSHTIFQQHLSEDERERAARFHFEPDRRRYVATRSILRSIVACYVAERPEQLRFRYEKHGRPVLMASPESDIEFNVSHSGEVFLIAVTRKRKVGVDVEKVRLDIEADEIAEHYFSPHEALLMRSLPRDQRPWAFFCCWTRKEAYMKACGKGLAMALDSFDVMLTSSGIDPFWQVIGFEPASGYVAALAYSGEPAQVRFLAANFVAEPSPHPERNAR